MRPGDVWNLSLLAALWGASFLLMRVSAPEFGAVPLIGLRMAIGAAVLLPLLVMRGRSADFRHHWRPVMAVGTLNSAVPFTLLAYATLHLGAGFTAVLNASAPLFGTLVAWVWFSERLDGGRVTGLLLGLAGVVVLVGNRGSLTVEGAWPMLAALGAAACYGFAANYTRARLAGADSLSVAAGSLLGAALLLSPLTLLYWPVQAISARAWVSVLALGVACTGLAYVLYFRLIARIGPGRAITVTFLVPLFAVLWGVSLLDETLTPRMVLGGAVILSGLALGTGWVRWPEPRAGGRGQGRLIPSPTGRLRPGRG